MKQLRFSDCRRAPEVARLLVRCRQPFRVLKGYLFPNSLAYPTTITLRDGTTLPVENYHDLVTAWVVNFREEYFLPKTARTVLDLGGNVGFFSLFAAQRLPEARIVAAEPFPSTFERFQANIDLNGQSQRIQCLNVGAAAEAGSRWMGSSGPSQSRGISPRRDRAVAADATGIESPDAGVCVQVVSLTELVAEACDRLESRTIDFAKIDIEGGEHEAILAAPDLALAPIQQIGMEYHPNQSKRPLFERLQTAGLRLVHDRPFGENVGVAHFRR